MNIKPIFKVSMKSMLRAALIYCIVIVCVFLCGIVLDRIVAVETYDTSLIDLVNEYAEDGEKAYLGENNEIIIEYADGSKDITYPDGNCTYIDVDGDEYYYDNGNVVSGMETSAGIFLFVCGIIFYKEMLWLGFANGISRKTVYLSTMLVGLATSVVLAVGLYLICGIFGLLLDYVSVFDQIYSVDWGVGYEFANGASKFTLNMLFDILSVFDAFLIGQIIGGVFYRANKAVQIIVAVGFPVTFAIILPSVIGYFSVVSKEFDVFLTKVSKVIEGIATSPVYTVVTLFTLAVVMFFVTFFTYRKAPLKAND